MYLVHPAIPVELFKLGPISIRWYSLMYIFGFLFFYWWTKREILKDRLVFAKKGDKVISIEILSDILFYAVFGILVGGRLGYVVFYNLGYFLQNPLAILKTWEGGMSFHGAFICVYFFCIIAMKVRKSDRAPFTLLDLSDIMLVSVPMGLALGRLGNFINGELYGRPTSMPWGMMFPRRPKLGHIGAEILPIEQVQNIIEKSQITLESNINQFFISGQEFIQIPRHPSQLYHFFLEGLLTLGLQMFLYYKVPSARYRGFLTGTFLISYGCFRTFTEFFRQPDPQIGFLDGNWITAGMLYSVPMFLVGIICLVISLNRKIPNVLRVK